MPMTIIYPHDFVTMRPPGAPPPPVWETDLCSLCFENQAHPLHWPDEILADMSNRAQAS